MSIVFFFEGLFGFENYKAGGRCFDFLGLPKTVHITIKSMMISQNPTSAAFVGQYCEQ